MSDPTQEARIRQLVLDALYERRVVMQGCFASNAAASDLVGCGPTALPIIEETIRVHVVPKVKPGTTWRALWGAVRGLPAVWNAYYRIAAHEHATDVARFLKGLPLPVQISAVIFAQAAFRQVPKQAVDVEIPAILWGLFADIAARVSDEDRPGILHLLGSFYRTTGSSVRRE